MVKQYAFYFDSTSCSGCKACQVACKDKHDLEVGRLWRRVYEVSGGDWQPSGNAWVPNVFAYNVSMSCNHCERPVCVEVCPTGAMHKRDDGIVLVSAEKCVGCGYCNLACPYSAPQYDKKAGKMTKCTFCYDELELGKPPACVAACPMRVMDFGEATDLADKYDQTADVFPLPKPTLTEPALLITPHKDAHRADSEPAQSQPERKVDAKKWSLIIFTVLSQMAVGAFWVLTAARPYLAPQYGSAQIDGLFLPPLLVIEIIMLFSLLISLAKLGSPFISYRAIVNFRSSWLSREIVFALLFTVSSMVFTFMLWAQVGSAAMQSGVGWLAAIFGFMLIYSMSRLYMLRTVPVWNTLFTPLSFFMTALILGCLVVGAVFAVTGSLLNAPVNKDMLAMVITGALFVLGCEFVLLIGRGAGYRSGSSKGKDTIQKLLASHRNVFYGRLLLGIAGFIGLSVMLLQAHFPPGFCAICFVLVLSAALADRFLFYKARDVSGI